MSREPRNGALTQSLRAFGECLKRMRIAGGITQERASEVLGVSPQAIRNWECGKHEPTIQHLRIMEELYGISIPMSVYILPRSEPLERTEFVRAIPINNKRYLLAGSFEHSDAQDMSQLPVPKFVLDKHPHLFAITVVGDSLSSIDVYDADLLFVDPDSPLREGDIRIVRISDKLFARIIEIHDGQLLLRGVGGGGEDLAVGQVQDVGKAIWHLRRLGVDHEVGS